MLEKNYETTKYVIFLELRDYWEKCRKKSAMERGWKRGKTSGEAAQQWSRQAEQREWEREREVWKRRPRGYPRWWNVAENAAVERGAVGMPAVLSRGALGGGWWQRSPRTAGGLLGRTRNLTTNGHATSGEPSLPASPGIHYLLVPCQPPHRHSYLILIYYLPRSVPL